jgi:sugar phosphate isomerase/epimerase
LERYTQDIVGTFGQDPRIVVWDLYNEPGNSNLGERSLPLVEAVFAWTRQVEPRQPLTIAPWTDFNSRMSRRLMELSDVVSFHGYDDLAGLRRKMATCREYDRPIVCTEWLHRPSGNTVETVLPLFQAQHVGCYHWGLVFGRTQTYMPWGSKPDDPIPPLWQHDLFHADGKPFRPQEVELFRLLTGTAPGQRFFAMDTALRDGQTRSATDQAALLKELGFDGFGTSGYPSDEFLAAFEQVGLRVFNTYLTLDFDAAQPALDPKLKEIIPRLTRHGTDLWVAINSVTRDGRKLTPSDRTGDAIVLPKMQELADFAQSHGVRIAFYPHTGFWLERVDDGFRIACAIDRPNVGTTFNLCHWLKVEGDRDPWPVLRRSMSRLFFVSINGADSGDTKPMDWNRLIQPLDAGTYDVAKLVTSLQELGYTGPIGFQGYGISGDSREILRRTMEAWQRIHGR